MAEETKNPQQSESKAVLEYYGPEATIHGIGTFERGAELTREDLVVIVGKRGDVALVAADLTARKWFRFAKTRTGTELERQAKEAAKKAAAAERTTSEEAASA